MAPLESLTHISPVIHFEAHSCWQARAGRSPTCRVPSSKQRFIVSMVQTPKRASKRKSGVPAEHGLLPDSGKKSKGASGKSGKAAGVAASGGGLDFDTPFGRAHFASAKAPGLQLTGAQMIDALRRCKAKSWYSAAPFTGDNKLPSGDGAADFVRMVDRFATLSGYGADPVRFARACSK